jgi:hypothetical protein
MGEEQKKGLVQKGINYYVIAGIFVSILIFIFLNSLEPQIDYQLDFFELMFVLGYAAPGVFALFVAKRYWGSKVFGKTYLSLGIAYSLTAIGAALFDYYQMYSKMANPYPYYPDIFFSSFYPFAIYHLSRNTMYFNMGKLKKRQIFILVIIPLGVTSIYVYGELVPASVPGSVPDLLSRQVVIGGNTFGVQPTTANSPYQHVVVGNTTYDLVPITLNGSTVYPQIYDPKVRFNLVPIVFKTTTIGTWPQHDQTFYNGFFAGVYYVAATTETFAWAIVGAQAFRRSVLGTAWGLLLAGIGLNAVADVSYYYTSIYTYDRSNPIIGIWILGCMIVCYALYLHKKKV